jgi:hypothetical protein
MCLMLILYTKLLFPFHVPHRIQTEYIACVTSDPPQCHIIKHFFAQDICSPCCSNMCTYIHVPTVSLCEKPYLAWSSQQWRNRIGGSCEYEQRNVNCLAEKCTELYFAQQLDKFVCYHYVCVYMSFGLKLFVYSLSQFQSLMPAVDYSQIRNSSTVLSNCNCSQNIIMCGVVTVILWVACTVLCECNYIDCNIGLCLYFPHFIFLTIPQILKYINYIIKCNNVLHLYLPYVILLIT